MATNNMAKKTKTPDLPGIAGKGVAPISIPDIDKAVDRYERKKEARCTASPGEVAAKNELRELLHANRSNLPLNEEGMAFYRKDGVDYILTETLKRRSTDDGADGEDE